MWAELPRVFDALDQDDSVRCVLLRGRGKNFCAGIDLGSLTALVEGDCPGRARERLRRKIARMQDSFSALERCRKAVVAAVQGACYGAGVDLIAACDVRLCTRAARFCVKEIDLGIVADIGTLQRLPRLVGQGRAAELALTARVFGGEEAERAGLVSRACGSEAELWRAAEETARTIAAKSPLAVVGTKRVLLHARDHGVYEGLDYVATWNAAMLVSNDLEAGFVAAQRGGKPAVYAKL